MVKRTVLKVDISCQKCKQKLIHAVCGIEGVDKIEVDGAKSTLTVTGDADPIEVIVRARKLGKFAEVVSIGPPPPPPKLVQEKQPEK
ncbi:heavy metal-associated isoprenylated plant protein 2-like [Elaeis guineensis]|uniref:Heavy metal-associated isoprenylated plant protein 43-like n=1 Tax=Elaeis guineensis var. tenera TaxID=51953 RepID=A0A6I9SAP1_ELAGV|nr:heavy metal-associated isoprenylated plant protein 43-like [Elaeis guineensis]